MNKQIYKVKTYIYFVLFFLLTLIGCGHNKHLSVQQQVRASLLVGETTSSQGFRRVDQEFELAKTMGAVVESMRLLPEKRSQCEKNIIYTGLGSAVISIIAGGIMLAIYSSFPPPIDKEFVLSLLKSTESHPNGNSIS
ncbi:MAG: hypothetical protein NQ127_01195 [Candidatus Cardinium sp.]|nr:hypothetical protein [Candidatus Cardinium sp.]